MQTTKTVLENVLAIETIKKSKNSFKNYIYKA